MPSASGEITIDGPDLIEDAEMIAATLEQRGTCSFHYGAFGTGWRMLAIDQRIIQGRIGVEDAAAILSIARSAAALAATTGSLYGRGVNGLSEDPDTYTLWLRELGNDMRGPWLITGGLHAPPYLADKFDCNVLDGYGIGVLIELVENARADRPLEAAQERIRHWTSLYEIDRHEDLPDFAKPDQGTQGATP